MSGSPSSPLQTAIYARLSGDTTLVTTLGAAVYDIAPDRAEFPYVTIGEQTESPNDTMGTTGRDITVTVHTWTRERTKQQAQLIQNRVDALLDRWAPTVTGWSATTMLMEFFETFRDEDGLTQHGVARYRIHITASA